MEILKQKADLLKRESFALTFAYQDKRTPWYAKVLIFFTLGYLLSPIDLIPDFIPVLGYFDDLIIIPFLIALSIKLIPDEVIIGSREKTNLFFENKKRKSWWFSVFVLVFWSSALLFLLKKFLCR